MAKESETVKLPAKLLQGSSLHWEGGKLVNYRIIYLIAGEENMMEDPLCILYLHIWNGFVGQVSGRYNMFGFVCNVWK